MAGEGVQYNPINYTQEITLDLNSNNAYTTVFSKQQDSARYLKISLTKDNIPYTIDPTHSFYFRMRKPDGHGIVNPAFVQVDNENINNSEGYVIVQLTEQCLAVAGRGYADLVEYDSGGSVLSSIPFILNIMSSPSLGSNITSNDEFQQLSQLMADTEALLQNAPMIDPDTKEWKRYSTDQQTFISTGVIAEGHAPRINQDTDTWEICTDGTNWEDTGIVAEGQDGDSFYLVDVLTGEPDSLVKQELVSIVLSGTSYYNDVAYEQQAGTTEKITAVYTENNNYYIIINDNHYYVKSEDVVNSTDQESYYSLTIPKGIQGIQGPRGERGAAGAGGVTWVDDIEANTQRRIDEDFPGFQLLGTINNCVWDPSKNKYTWSSFSGDDFDYETVSQYINIIISDTDTLPSEPVKYYINAWDNSEGGPYYFTLFEDEVTQTHPVSKNIAYLFGERGVESGNVQIQAVSYKEQTAFITRNEYGYAVQQPITDAMRLAARNNIGAMKAVSGNNNGDVLTYDAATSQWISAQPIQPQTLLNRLTYNDLNQVIQNYSYTSVNGG